MKTSYSQSPKYKTRSVTGTKKGRNETVLIAPATGVVAGSYVSDNPTPVPNSESPSVNFKTNPVSICATDVDPINTVASKTAKKEKTKKSKKKAI